MKINNITFSLQEYGQEFSFTGPQGQWHHALLQLPTTPDSQNTIDGKDYSSDNAEMVEIFKQLRDFYYSQFSDKECAKASALLGYEVTHVVCVDNLYVTFSTDRAEVIVEGRASGYYNVFYFEKFQGREDVSESEIVEKGKAKLFSDLNSALKNKLSEYAESTNFEGSDTSVVEQCFDDIVHEFMVSEFGTRDYSDLAISGEFYQWHACDARNDAIREAIENI